MERLSELEVERCIGWLYIGTLPHYVMANEPNAEIKAMRRARATVIKLLNANELLPLMAAFDMVKQGETDKTNAADAPCAGIAAIGKARGNVLKALCDKALRPLLVVFGIFKNK